MAGPRGGAVGALCEALRGHAADGGDRNSATRDGDAGEDDDPYGETSPEPVLDWLKDNPRE